MKRAIMFLAVMLLALPCLAAAQAEETPGLTVETALCTGVEDRMPVGEADTFPAEVGQVCLWSKVLGCQDTTMIKHVWYFKGEEMAEVQLPVRSPAWRTYSIKTIPPEWAGDWVVKVVDAQGNVLKALPFKVGAAMEKPAMEKPVKVKPADTTKVGE